LHASPASGVFNAKGKVPIEIDDDDEPEVSLQRFSSLTTLDSSSALEAPSTPTTPAKPPVTPRRVAVMDAIEITSPPIRRTRRIHKPSAKSALLKAPVTPRQPTAKPLPPAKRRKKFESDSDDEYIPDTVVHVRPPNTRRTLARIAMIPGTPPKVSPQAIENLSKSSARTASSKKRRLSRPTRDTSLLHPPNADDGRLRVPSSQSDEHELVLPPLYALKEREELKEHIEYWRQEAVQPSAQEETPLWTAPFLHAETEMDTTSLPFDDISAGNSSAEVGAYLAVDEFARDTTPEPVTLDRLPATPVALDPTSKTAQIIADIKAGAAKLYAPGGASSSPESDIPDELSSSSEEKDDDLFADIRGKPR
jgi:hypothetical protein